MPAATARPGQVVRGILLFAEERDADMVVRGASSRGRSPRAYSATVPLGSSSARAVRSW